MTKKTYKKLKRIADYSEKIFAPLNKKYCSNCICNERYGNETILWKESGRGCCANCASNRGYFISNDIDKNKQVEKLKKRYNFDKEYGFFDNINKCCKLPRIRRSHTCLGFTCSDLRHKVEIENKVLAYELYHAGFGHREGKLGRKLADMIKIRRQHNIAT
jgi:hypothetical protein